MFSKWVMMLVLVWVAMVATAPVEAFPMTLEGTIRVFSRPETHAWMDHFRAAVVPVGQQPEFDSRVSHWSKSAPKFMDSIVSNFTVHEDDGFVFYVDSGKTWSAWYRGPVGVYVHTSYFPTMPSKLQLDSSEILPRQGGCVTVCDEKVCSHAQHPDPAIHPPPPPNVHS